MLVAVSPPLARNIVVLAVDCPVPGGSGLVAIGRDVISSPRLDDIFYSASGATRDRPAHGCHDKFLLLTERHLAALAGLRRLQVVEDFFVKFPDVIRRLHGHPHGTPPRGIFPLNENFSLLEQLQNRLYIILVLIGLARDVGGDLVQVLDGAAGDECALAVRHAPPAVSAEGKQREQHVLAQPAHILSLAALGGLADDGTQSHHIVAVLIIAVNHKLGHYFSLFRHF